MTPEMQDAFDTSVIDEACRRFGAEPNSVALIGTHQNLVYSCSVNGMECILRVTHSSHRSEKMIRGELAWIRFLVQHGFPGPSIRSSSRQDLVEAIDIGGAIFFAVVFSRFQGQTLINATLTNELCRDWGGLVGFSHHLTKTYVPPPMISRPEWHELDCFNIDKYFPPSRHRLKTECLRIIERIACLPASQSDYGLIHSDLHAGNFLRDNVQGELCCFDFDDCHFNWFLYDIATALFFASRMKCSRAPFSQWFLENFLDGYAEQNDVADGLLTCLPLFMQLREIAKCVLYHKMYVLKDGRWDYSGLNDRQAKRLALYLAHLEAGEEYLQGFCAPAFRQMLR